MKNNWIISLFVFVVFSVNSTISFALAYNITPKAGTSLPTQVVKGGTATALYTVTNNTSRTIPDGFVKYLPQSVTQVNTDTSFPDLCGATFTLTPGASCTLELSVAGAVSAANPDPHQHLFVCSPNLPACAGTSSPLNVSIVPATLTGTVQSGGTTSVAPIANALVTIYGADQSSAIPLGTSLTNSSGKFYINVPSASLTHTIYYAIATKGTKTELAVILGESIPLTTTINEMTTVGAAWSMAQFFHTDPQIYGKALGLKIAAGMNDNLVSIEQGALSTVITTSPNADQTNAMRSVSSLSNLIAPCVQNIPGACTALFAATTVDAVVPTNTLQALLAIAHNPSMNVTTIFALAQMIQIYRPDLSMAPDAWTLAVKFNYTGNDNYLFGGLGKIVFDSNGFAWITNNVIQGTPNSSNFIVVLKPNGQPADGTNNTPVSPIFGGGILGQGFGISFDLNGNNWSGNFGWGSCSVCLPAAGSVTKLTATGIPISGPTGYIDYVYRGQGVVPDQNNNIWIASYGNDRVVIFPNGDPNSSFYFQEPSNSTPFDIAIDQNNAAWVTNPGTSILSKYTLNGHMINNIFNLPVGDNIKEVSIDSQGNAWIASTADSSVYKVNSAGTSVTQYTGVGGMSGPWGVTLDGADHVWVANFGPPGQPVNLSVTELCGVNTAACPPGVTTGQAISPATGYTLPSAGSQVLLHNGDPLNGPGSEPVFTPLMRLTQVLPDQAGNIWALNNWKPIPFNPTTDFNPGGDGAVVFIGLAVPPN